MWLAANVLGVYQAIKIVKWAESSKESHEEKLRHYQAEFNGIKAYAPISQKHDGLLDIFHAAIREEAGYYYYVLPLADDLVRGANIDPNDYTPKTLSNYLESGEEGRLSAEESIDIIQQVAFALHQLHGEGVVHRDIKPDNIICVNGKWRLSDIGLVAGQGAGSFVGSLGYLAPEGPGKPVADIFSLGKVLYTISTGKTPDSFPDYPTWAFGSHAEQSEFQIVNGIACKACEFNPQDRFQNTLELIRALQSKEDYNLVHHKQPSFSVKIGISLAICFISIILFFILKDSPSKSKIAGTNKKAIAGNLDEKLYLEIDQLNKQLELVQKGGKETDAKELERKLKLQISELKEQLELANGKEESEKENGEIQQDKKERNGTSPEPASPPPVKSPILPEDLGLKLYYPFNGNCNDESGNGNHGIINGARPTRDRHGVDGRAYQLTLSITDITTSFTFKSGKSPRTICMWFKPDSLFSSDQGFFQNYGGAKRIPLLHKVSPAVSIWDNGTVGFDGSARNAVFTGDALTVGKWHHLILSYSGQINTMKVWVDGKALKAQKAGFWDYGGTSPFRDTTSPLKIPGVNGSVDELRVYDRALSDAEMAKLYAREKTPVTNTNSPAPPAIENSLVASYPFDGNTRDESQNGKSNLTTHGQGARPCADRFARHNRAYEFDGRSHLEAPMPSGIGGSKPFSIAMWVSKTDLLASRNSWCFQMGKDSGPNKTGIMIAIHPTVAVAFGPRKNSKVKIGFNRWHHLVTTYNGNGVVDLYLDGQFKDRLNGQEMANLNIDPNGKVVLGRSLQYPEFFKGRLDEVKIYTKQLTPQEIESLWNSEKTP